VTADLHWGIRPKGDDATRQLVEYLRHQPPDVLVLAGDVGAGSQFAACLEIFRDLPCVKAVVPGNHDIWVEADDPRGDSLEVYRRHLPRICAEAGFHYLDGGPLVMAATGLAIVGSINWYDYTWSIDELKTRLPDWENRLKTKVFTRGRHNDARYVRWGLDDGKFTEVVVQTLETHLQRALKNAGKAIVVTHHPPVRDLGFPRQGERSIDALLWDAFTGNTRLEGLLLSRKEQIPFTICGHTHISREYAAGGMRGFNVGGDYDFKRLLILDWPAGTVEAKAFTWNAGSEGTDP
jgi:3',5'-cyclic AMP phosphodiesterase CpdA